GFEHGGRKGLLVFANVEWLLLPCIPLLCLLMADSFHGFYERHSDEQAFQLGSSLGLERAGLPAHQKALQGSIGGIFGIDPRIVLRIDALANLLYQLCEISFNDKELRVLLF